ncbi:Uncharacterised protein [Mycobacteroides abscessus subsp. bolletii]|nr:Uncharacterised protein [Mycobacteroides abscessus subsp. bolletii]
MCPQSFRSLPVKALATMAGKYASASVLAAPPPMSLGYSGSPTKAKAWHPVNCDGSSLWKYVTPSRVDLVYSSGKSFTLLVSCTV